MKKGTFFNSFSESNISVTSEIFAIIPACVKTVVPFLPPTRFILDFVAIMYESHSLQLQD